MAKAKKYGTIIDSDPVCTRTKSKIHRDYPCYVSQQIKDALNYIGRQEQFEKSVAISSYQVKEPLGIWEYMKITIEIHNRTLEWLQKFVKHVENRYQLFSIDSNHICKLWLHDHKQYGRYQDHTEQSMVIIEFKQNY